MGCSSEMTGGGSQLRHYRPAARGKDLQDDLADAQPIWTPARGPSHYLRACLSECCVCVPRDLFRLARASPRLGAELSCNVIPRHCGTSGTSKPIKAMFVAVSRCRRSDQRGRHFAFANSSFGHRVIPRWIFTLRSPEVLLCPSRNIDLILRRQCLLMWRLGDEL